MMKKNLFDILENGTKKEKEDFALENIDMKDFYSQIPDFKPAYLKIDRKNKLKQIYDSTL